VIVPHIVKSSKLYKEVMELGQQKGISITFNEFFKESPEGQKGWLGSTRYIKELKSIRIGIASSSLSDQAVFIHELLHAKSYLLGYPGIQKYSNIPFPPFMNLIMESMQNTIHHLFVYREMKLLGVCQKSIDTDFFENIKQGIKHKVEGIGKLAIIFNLLEVYVRDEFVAEEMVEIIKETHQEELYLYNLVKSALKETNSPAEMRKTFISILKIINDFVKEETKEDLFLNIIIKVDPIFPDTLLPLKASSTLQAVRLKDFPHDFVLDKRDNQCCWFLSRNGEPLEENYINSLLNQCTLQQFLHLINE